MIDKLTMMEGIPPRWSCGPTYQISEWNSKSSKTNISMDITKSRFDQFSSFLSLSSLLFLSLSLVSFHKRITRCGNDLYILFPVVKSISLPLERKGGEEGKEGGKENISSRANRGAKSERMGITGVRGTADKCVLSQVCVSERRVFNEFKIWRWPKIILPLPHPPSFAPCQPY